MNEIKTKLFKTRHYIRDVPFRSFVPFSCVLAYRNYYFKVSFDLKITLYIDRRTGIVLELINRANQLGMQTFRIAIIAVMTIKPVDEWKEAVG